MAVGETRVFRIIERMGRARRATVIGLGAALLFGVSVADYASGPELSFSIFYLLPVAFLAWYVSRSAGVVCALVGAALWLTADLLSRHSYGHWLVPYWNGLVRLGFFLLFALLLSRLRRALERERRLSRADSLTGVANSRAFLETVAEEIGRARRFGHPFSIAFLDCDNFKEVNDRSGHAVGDEVLRAVAQTIASHARRVDSVARVGGDEFAVLLPETSADRALGAIERLRADLLDAMRRRSWPVTFSIGVASFARAPATVDDALRPADELMYEAKRSGKNTIRAGRG